MDSRAIFKMEIRFYIGMILGPLNVENSHINSNSWLSSGRLFRRQVLEFLRP